MQTCRQVGMQAEREASTHRDAGRLQVGRQAGTQSFARGGCNGMNTFMPLGFRGYHTAQLGVGSRHIGRHATELES